MSKKVFKKVRKVVAKFDLGHQLAKRMGLPDPSGDLLYGSDRALSPTEMAQKQQRDMMDQQMDIQNQEMQMQMDAANQQALQNANLQASMAERERLAQQAADAGRVENDKVTVELATSSGADTRKRFRGQIGGTGKSTTSIRV